MKKELTFNGKVLRLKEPSPLDKAGVGLAAATADVDFPRVAIGILGLCIVQGPRRQPREPLAEYGERVWGWLHHGYRLTDDDLGVVLAECYVLIRDLASPPAPSPSDERVEDARGFLEPAQTPSTGSGSPSTTPETPSDG